MSKTGIAEDIAAFSPQGWQVVQVCIALSRLLKSLVFQQPVSGLQPVAEINEHLGYDRHEPSGGVQVIVAWLLPNPETRPRRG